MSCLLLLLQPMPIRLLHVLQPKLFIVIMLIIIYSNKGHCHTYSRSTYTLYARVSFVRGIPNKICNYYNIKLFPLPHKVVHFIEKIVLHNPIFNTIHLAPFGKNKYIWELSCSQRRYLQNTHVVLICTNYQVALLRTIFYTM